MGKVGGTCSEDPDSSSRSNGAVRDRAATIPRQVGPTILHVHVAECGVCQ